MVFANDWALSSTMMQMHDNKLHPVRFSGRVLKENEVNYHPAEKEVLALLQLLKINYTLVSGKAIHVYTRFSTLEWVFTSKTLYGRAVSFAVLLSPFHPKVKRVGEREVEFAQLLQATITPSVGLDESLAHVAPPSKNSVSIRMDPELLYAHVPPDFDGYVMSFDGSAKTEKYGGYGSCSWILWRLPTWDILIAASAHLSSTTVNIAEYSGMNHGVQAATERGVTDLIIVGDSRLAIQQSMGVIACRKDSLQVELARHKKLVGQFNSIRYLHIVRCYNSAADALATEALEAKAGRVVLSSDRKRELQALNMIQEKLYIDSSANVVQETPTVSAITRSQNRQGRRVRFAEQELDDSARDQPEPVSPADETSSSPSTNDSLEGEFKAIYQPPETRRVEAPAMTAPERQESLSALDVDPLVVQAERRGQISVTQDEECKWADLKKYLRGEFDELTRRRTTNAGKIADRFVLGEDGLLYYVGQRRERKELSEGNMRLRLVVPTTLIDEIVQNCHSSIEGGHQGIVKTYYRVKADYHWIGLYADVVKHVQACEDCNTSKSKPHLQGYAPGNVVSLVTTTA